MLAVRSVFVRPAGLERAADGAKALLSVDGGDHLTLLNVFNEYMNSLSFFLPHPLKISNHLRRHWG